MDGPGPAGRTTRAAARGLGPTWVGTEPLLVIPGPVIEVPIPGARPEPPSQHFRILRPVDLVVLDVLGYDLEAVTDPESSAVHLEAAGSGARLEVRFTFQHLHETAEPEPEGPSPFPLTAIPVAVRAANGSRLVYDVPDGERVELTTQGVLEAMSRLPLRVAPLALPRSVPNRFTAALSADAVHSVVLPGGLELVRSAVGLVLAPTRSAATTAPATAREVITRATSLRTARHMLSTERAVDLTRASRPPGSRGPGELTFEPPVVRRRRQAPRAPRGDETAIEAPFRLILSPSIHGGFAHAVEPQRVEPDPDRARDPERVELWHSRLGVRRVDSEGEVVVDEVRDPQKAVRAIWARDMDEPAPDVIGFLASLTEDDRIALVRQTADPSIVPPVPVPVDRLYLSSLGAWLDLHGGWDTEPYDVDALHALSAWDHEATSGRDNYVRVVVPYYLFPFGHKASLITITERKIKEVSNPQARLYQRKFITLREPVKSFSDRQMPFKQIRIRPLVTPNLDFQPPPPFPPVVAGTVPGFGEELFWPHMGGAKYAFVLDCLDHDGRRVILRAPLLAVAARLGTSAEKTAIVQAYDAAPERTIGGDGQSIAMGESSIPGDTAFETVALRFTGAPGDPGMSSTPSLTDADVVVPAMRHLAPSSNPVTVSYAAPYLSSGFGGANAAGQVLLELASPTTISFSGGTDKAGGFVQPDLPVRGLSRAIGIVGDIDSVVAPTTPGFHFDPTSFLSGVLPKLFGLFELTDILALAGLDKAPKFITDQLDKIAALVADVEDLVGAVERAVTRLQDDVVTAPTTALKDQAEQARAAIAAVQADLATVVQQLTTAIDALLALDEPSEVSDVAAAVSGLLDDLRGFVGQLDEAVRQFPMPPSAKAELERLVGALAPLLELGAVAETIEAIASFVNGIDPSNMAIRARFEWRPELTNFPASATNPDDALFFVPSDGFVLSVEARASGGEGVGFDVLAELRDFGLNLFPGAPLLKMGFDRLAFRSASGRKPEVDVVFTGMQWQGILGFIETLQRLIPFDGFSDPPYVDVSTDGVTAGFDLALPNASVGVFSLENISLGADVRVPFLGDALTVGFNFCTREKPFRMTVMAIGGGGFVGLRLSPKGLVMLEMSLEAGASLSINLGVASGSVSVMVGLYMRLEGEEGSLTGYFRIRGEVDVLGLISASITLELSLTYEFHTGKMVGRATITVKISVLFFSASVKISCERRLAGSKGDPTLAQILGVPDDGVALTEVPAAWSDYVGAFAGG
jgi:hypothetical protein